MTPDEYDAWFDHHRACFPRIEKWFGDIPVQIRPATEAAWLKVLSRTSLQDAKDASDEFFAGGDIATRYFDRHPQAIAAIARRLKAARLSARRYVDGQKTFRCLRCEDDGRIWEREYFDACDCEAGEPYIRSGYPRAATAGGG